jgi:hypothetical protein
VGSRHQRGGHLFLQHGDLDLRFGDTTTSTSSSTGDFDLISGGVAASIQCGDDLDL